MSNLDSPLPASQVEQDETTCNTQTPSPTLSQLQYRALDLLLQCRSDSDINELNISRTTLWRWKTHDPDFRSELASRREDAWNAAVDRYQLLLNKASAVVERKLDSHGHPEQLQAAQLLFYMAGRFKPTRPLNLRMKRRLKQL